MSLKVGITGGMGAGKSMISEIFRSFGIPVYDADMMAKNLMREHPGLKEAIQKVFGRKAYLNGDLNRPFIAQKIFNESGKLTRMNNLVHPVVISDYNSWLQGHAHQPYTIKEAALLFESGSYKDLDKIILVSAPKSVRINRVLMRDGHRNRSDIENIMNNQMSNGSKKKLSDYIIINDEQRMIIPQVLDIHEQLLKCV
jgi:dephospho-CoA kinase